MNINKLIALLLLLVVATTSCVEDDDFDTPDTTTGEVTIDGTVIDIDAVLGILAQAQLDGDDSFTFDQDDTSYVEGFVVSSDEAGNFFEEIVIQDKAENPTAGIVVLIDVNPLFTSYEFGRKIFVKLAGLTVATTNGVSGLGIGGGTFIEKIPAPSEGDVIVRSNEVATIVPKEIAISDFSDEMENLFIRLNNMQFNRNDVLGANPLTFAAEDADEFDGERNLESCDEGNVVILSTSTFADFKGLLLPDGQGSVDGVLTRDFFDDFYTLVINEPSNFNFGGVEDRCDPDFFFCETTSGGGTAFFEDDFDSYGDFSDAEAAGWTNVNISGGSVEWELGNFDGTNYAQISGFSSGEDEIDVWLVSPTINMDGTTGEELNFDVQTNFDNGTILSVYFSTNFTGDPTTADWTLLDATIPTGPGGGFGDFEAVGPVNISCIDGDINIGFFYEGSDPTGTTRYHVDNVAVTGN